MPATMSDAAAKMDRIYGLQRHIYDATRKYYLLGRDDLIRGLDVPAGGTVLEVGCGTGRNLILAARRYPAARLYGLDVSAAMLETAAASVARTGLQDRITLRQGDAVTFSGEALFGVSQFDRVFISYALSMIPPWREALERAFAATKPGGSLHIVDFGEQEGLPRLFRMGLRAWLKRFHVTPRDDLEGELEALAARHGASLTLARPFRDFARYAVVRRGGVLLGCRLS